MDQHNLSHIKNIGQKNDKVLEIWWNTMSDTINLEIWRSNIDWDEKIHPEQYEKWLQWIKVLRDIEKLQIPRAYTTCENSTSAELHIFMDASENAYATVAYWRYEVGKTIEVALIGGKIKVAPTRTFSIPRLELKGAILTFRFAKFIKSNHTIKIQQCYFWCNSSNVLSWIRSDARKYKQFVAVRIGELLESTESSEWVKTKRIVDDAIK